MTGASGRLSQWKKRDECLNTIGNSITSSEAFRRSHDAWVQEERGKGGGGGGGTWIV